MANAKPEHLTHLRGSILIDKTSAIIAFRGELDLLECEVLLSATQITHAAAPATITALDEIATLCSTILRCEVTEEPLHFAGLLGCTSDELRDQSHHPQKYFGSAHRRPQRSDGVVALWLQRLRALARKVELSAIRAFYTDEKISRPDIILALNRLSSALYILSLKESAV